MHARVKTDFLFSSPSGISGAARLLDIFGTYDNYNESATPAEADRRAILSDWLSVGYDLEDAVGQYQQESPTP